ncbi:hypothetical protein [Acinetobacter baumannii]|uniref:hypothetical protein n=1 Tax=Acinetobacter baumannii TaxID=470 RepID=UPI000D65CA95|nr:hypothetical protein [Acinetobacter baumannii]EHU2485689.1 hypothetical protein [Acinetobacter baumannii]HAV4518285.1 hypothetical protein [Acinetobacter baumannii]HAV4579101.1 hypothetical protein [Acinetobacter baumannii]
MAIDASIPLQAQGINVAKMIDDGSQIGQIWQQQRLNKELDRIYNESQGNVDKMLQLGQQSQMARYVVPQIQAQQAARQKNLLDQQKTLAEIANTTAQANERTANAGNTTFDTSQKKYGAIQGAFQQAAMTGDKGTVLLALDALQRTGAITPEDYAHNFKVVSVMSPDEIKQYATGSGLLNKDLAPYLSQTKNNEADNATSVANNIRTTDASRYATDTAAATADKNRAQDAQQFSQKQQLDEWLAKNKPIGTEMGNDGYMYAIYPGGKGVRISDERGSPIQVQPKGSNSTVASQNEEKQRISRVNAVLDEIQGILPQATASYAGRGIDLLARGVGLATPGDVATGKLGTLGGQLVALMPKMSGPQSDKDVAMYKQMAGQLDDPTIPLQVRQAALETIRSLNNKYAEMNSQRPATVPYRNDAPTNTQPQNQAKLNNILFGK